MRCRWIQWNVNQCTKHGCTIAEIESVLSNIGRGFPRKVGNGKYLVIGRGQGGRMMEIFYVPDPAPEVTVFPIHAMPLTTRRRRNKRR